MDPLQPIRDEFEALWGRLGPFWGVAPTTARVHAWLLSQPDPADGARIAAGLSMSRGAVSMACRELIDWGLVESERTSGSRRVSYRAVTDPEKVIRAIVQTRKRREWDPMLEKVRAWQVALATRDSREAEHLRLRLADIEALIALVDSHAERFLKGGVVQRLGLRTLVSHARSQLEKKRRRTR